MERIRAFTGSVCSIEPMGICNALGPAPLQGV
jgi:hypothetical protein